MKPSLRDRPSSPSLAPKDRRLTRRWVDSLLPGLLCLALACAATCAEAEVRLHGLFADHMVLQRDQPLRVWGWADPGEAVNVTLHRQHRRTVADRAGRWVVQLAAERAGGPHEMVVRASNTLRLQDLLIGEVWLCAGQSNMEWTLAQAEGGAADVAASGDDQIRHVKLAHRHSMQPQDDIEPVRWQPSNARSAGDFSAVAYHFARQLRRELGVPVGLINTAWGGTHLETWMSPQALASHPELRQLLPATPRSPADFAAAHRARSLAVVRRWQGDLPLPEDTAAWASPEHDDRSWPTLQAPGSWEQQGLAGFDGKLWYRKRITLTAEQATQPASLALGMVDDCDETFVNGERVGGLCGWDQPRHYPLLPGLLRPGDNLLAVRVTDTGGAGGFHGKPEAMQLQFGAQQLALAGPWQARVEAPLSKSAPDVNDLPSLLFNGMVNPIVGFGLRGVLWYQGESNVDRAAQYLSTFPHFITDLRQRWGAPDLPFFFVQLASFLPLERNTLVGSAWAELRDAQRQALALPHTGMVVTTDIGDALDIHPRNKREVGQRLARLALRRVHRKPVVDSGPTLEQVRVLGDRIELRFSHSAGALLARGGPLQGFALADASRVFKPAQARIVGNRVIVMQADIQQPTALRFGWVDNPQQSNLFNREGLPASPFRTDDWPRITQGQRFGL